jgi:hypothetical protein
MFIWRSEALERPVAVDRAFRPADAVLCVVIFAAAAAIAAWGFAVLGPALESANSFNTWFQADNPRVIANLTDVSSNHYRTAVHPIASLLLTPIVIGLHHLGLPWLMAAEALIVGCGAGGAALLFAALRRVGLPRWPAVLFMALYLSSAAYLHWYCQIELSPPAAVTISLAILALCYGPATSRLAWVLVSAATLSITVTNWSAGLAASVARWRLWPAAVISGIALALVIVLSLVQYRTFSDAALFFRPHAMRAETNYTAFAGAKQTGFLVKLREWPLTPRLRSLLVTTVVAPTAAVEIQDGDQVITNQTAAITDNAWYGVLAAVAWMLLLLCGVLGAGLGLVRGTRLRPVAVGLGLMLLAQIGLHSVYGDPTFLYSAHFLPMLVLLAALSWFSPLRVVALVLAGVVVLAGGASNLRQFEAAAGLARQIYAAGGNAQRDPYRANAVLLAAPQPGPPAVTSAATPAATSPAPPAATSPMPPAVSSPAPPAVSSPAPPAVSSPAPPAATQ